MMAEMCFATADRDGPSYGARNPTYPTGIRRGGPIPNKADGRRVSSWKCEVSSDGPAPGPIVRNEANFPVQQDRSPGPILRNEPNSPSAGQARLGTVAPNKANLPPDARKWARSKGPGLEDNSAKRSQFCRRLGGRCRGQSRRTKPIPGEQNEWQVLCVTGVMATRATPRDRRTKPIPGEFQV